MRMRILPGTRTDVSVVSVVSAALLEPKGRGVCAAVLRLRRPLPCRWSSLESLMSPTPHPSLPMTFLRLTLIALAATLLQPTMPRSVRAAEAAWINLLDGDKLDAFKPVKGGWYFAESVSADEKTRRLIGVKGSGILVNGEKGRETDRYTKESFGDLELHVEFLIPKGSNSGVKFHGVYEIQISDSYGRKELTGDSCGGIYPRAEDKPTYRHIDKGV